MNVKGLILAGIVSTTISCQSVKKETPSETWPRWIILRWRPSSRFGRPWQMR